jgi:hypothetical protein
LNIEVEKIQNIQNKSDDDTMTTSTMMMVKRGLTGTTNQEGKDRGESTGKMIRQRQQQRTATIREQTIKNPEENKGGEQCTAIKVDIINNNSSNNSSSNSKTMLPF